MIELSPVRKPGEAAAKDLYAIRARVEAQLTAAGGLGSLSAVLLRYDSFLEWKVSARETDDDFETSRMENEVLAIELTLRGVRVYGVHFEVCGYLIWNAGSRDSRDRRNLWARSRLMPMATGVFAFSLNDPAADPVCSEVAELFHCDPACTGWVPYLRAE